MDLKRQGIVECATYGAKIVTRKMKLDHLIGLRYDLQIPGVSIDIQSILFSNNQSVITNVTQPGSKLKKSHQLISYH